MFGRTYKLSAEQLESLTKHFNELDLNGDGVLSKSEAVELLAQLDMFDEAQMASFWAGQADDDKINFQEFMEIHLGAAPKPKAKISLGAAAKVVKLAAKLNRDDDGAVAALQQAAEIVEESKHD